MKHKRLKIASKFVESIYINLRLLLLFCLCIFNINVNAKTPGDIDPFLAVENMVNVVFNTDQLEHLDPLYCETEADKVIINHLFSGLMRLNEHNELERDLIAFYSLSEDKKTYTFNLRLATWSDGVPLTAKDIVYSLKRLFTEQPISKYQGLLKSVKNGAKFIKNEITDVNQLGIRIIDDHSFLIELETPMPYFLNILAHCATFPVPMHIVEANKNWASQDKLVGSGPYVKIKFLDKILVLDKNLKYYDFFNIKVDRIRYRFNEDFQQAISEYELGKVQIIESPPPYLRVWLSKKYPQNFLVSSLYASYYYVFNLKNSKLSNIKIRQALSLAIDRETLITANTQAYFLATEYIVPKNFKDIKHDSTVQKYEQKLQIAKDIMQGLGYSKEKPLEITLSYNTHSMHEWIAKIIASMWKEIGVSVVFRDNDLKDYFDHLKDGDFEIARASWRGDYYDPYNFMVLFTNHELNYGRYQNSQFDELLKQASEVYDNNERLKILTNVEKIVLDDYAIIPLFHYTYSRIVSKRLKGVSSQISLDARRWILEGGE